MTQPRSPLDQALDLLVYAPVGLALLIRDELPRLVEKGKSQTDAQVALARMLGKMAAGRGQQEMGKMFTELWARISGEGGTATEEPPAPEPEDTPVPAPSGDPAPPARSKPSADDLAIPGYDALSAPQVVQRLSGLSPDELEAVGAYEAATRHRQTILGRIAQLQSAGS